MATAVFAIPGDKDRRTGGFIYEATVLNVLNDIGCLTHHLELPDSCPNPTPADMKLTLDLLRAVPDTVGDAAVLVPVDDPVAFAVALRRLLTEPNACAHFSDLSRQRAAAVPTWENTAQTFTDVISNVMLGRTV